ncbi:hypothetical protein [Acinetobacter courvalinii]|uniref:hypothetical protein n=1 Tax=Acinetobacter courvalinii TaxID=280147 RepID=UPI00289EAEB7|nr:hypothetical protein [Acinetobacter courvalinii]
MLKEINLFNGISLIESITISSFIAIGFSFLYKSGYYNTLGFPWLINTVNPQLILISSIKFLFLFISFFIIGGIFIKFIGLRLLTLSLTAIIPLVIQFLIIIIKSKFNPLFLGYINHSAIYTILASFSFGAIFTFGYSTQLNFFKYVEKKSHKLLIFLGLFLSFYSSLIYMPYKIGEFDANFIINTPYYQNLVDIGDLNGYWIIVDIIGDKAIIRETHTKKFKIIELKEIKSIKSYKTLINIKDVETINRILNDKQ